MGECPARIGSYDVIVELASGGMATTYLAHKRGEFFFERLVVLKRIHPWLVEKPGSCDMLREEARVAASIQHPNVVHVEDVIQNDHEVCLVMPYVESVSLGALIHDVRKAGERIEPGIASRIMIDVLMGLDAAHEAKDLRGVSLEIVHRDVSPRNVLVGSDGRSRIIDFGIARAAGRLHHTRSGDMKGTVAYMSPEQIRRRELDRRADVFAAGAVLFEALTTNRLFDGRDEADILVGVLADEIPTVGGAIDEVFARALSRDRDERFATARAFAQAIAEAIEPAQPRDVAAFVERLAASELMRRRNAVMAFVDNRMARSVQPSDERWRTSEDVTQSADKRRSNHRRIIAMTFAVVVLVAVLSVVIRLQRPLNTPVPVSSRGIVGAQRIDPSPLPQPMAMPHQSNSAAPIKTDAAPSTHTTAALPNASAVVRFKPPIQERVDKRRANELQENPYR